MKESMIAKLLLSITAGGIVLSYAKFIKDSMDHDYQHRFDNEYILEKLPELTNRVHRVTRLKLRNYKLGDLVVLNTNGNTSKVFICTGNNRLNRLFYSQVLDIEKETGFKLA